MKLISVLNYVHDHRLKFVVSSMMAYTFRQEVRNMERLVVLRNLVNYIYFF